MNDIPTTMLADGITLANGITVSAWIADDGAAVVQIDTPADSDAHDTTRVYMNDARADHWIGVGEPGYDA